MSKKRLEYWNCLIGPYDLSDYKFNGADGPLRMVVRDKFNELFGPDEICSSGWGIDEKRADALRTLFTYPTTKLVKLIKLCEEEN